MPTFRTCHRIFTLLCTVFLCIPAISATTTPPQETSPSTTNATDHDPGYITARQIRDTSARALPNLRSRVAFVYDVRENEILLERNPYEVMPIASLTKLMTAMVVLDANLDPDEIITITQKDSDTILHSPSRLRTGMQFKRNELLLIALMASDNRAALALGRTFPEGMDGIVTAMNEKARSLNLAKTRFADPAGLSIKNVSTATELMQLVKSANGYPTIRDYTTMGKTRLTDSHRGHSLNFANTNILVNHDAWPITLSKTGFTSKAGNCLVMHTEINSRPVIIVLLQSWGRLSKFGDSNRIKKWLNNTEQQIIRKQARPVFTKSEARSNTRHN